MSRSIHEWIMSGSVSEGVAERLGYVELVRCKDCKHYSTIFNGDVEICNKCSNDIRITTSDWFCADGERRESE